MITARIVADSVSKDGDRLVTLELNYPRYIHAEVMTHRVFSRNAQSSRAIPVNKAIELLEKEPVEPVFMKNQPGMQADNELNIQEKKAAYTVWTQARNSAIMAANTMIKIGVHKQIANRLLEPFSNIRVILSGTEFDGFFKLRIAPDAQQEICILAKEMRLAIDNSIPEILEDKEWHLPYVSKWERDELLLDDLIRASVARCARVSYLNHDKSRPNILKDVELHDFLLEAKHMSPFEHIATPIKGRSGNFNNWYQYRETVQCLG